jgi:hypothetical protein
MIRCVGAVALLFAGIVGCRHESISGTAGLGFAAGAVLSPPPAGRVVSTATVTNVTDASLTVNYSDCMTALVLHTGSYDGPVVYDQRPGRLCAAIAQQKVLAPGESLTFSEVDTPGLASGTYYATVEVAANGSTSVPAGIVVF